MKLSSLLLVCLATACTTHVAVHAQTSATGVPCHGDLDEINFFEAEKAPEDVTTERLYILCPNTEFIVGIRDQNGEFQQGSFAMTLRPNMKIQCGEDGSRDNNCRVTTGTAGLIVSQLFAPGEYIENAVVQGVTFDGIREVGLVFETYGTITLIDCAVVNMRNIAPVIVQYDGSETGLGRRLEGDSKWPLRYTSDLSDRKKTRKDIEATADSNNDARKLQENKVTVVFEDCVMEDNQYAAPDLPGVVSILGSFNDVTLRRTAFRRNLYANEAVDFSYIVLSEQATLTIESCCFEDNDVSVVAPVTVFLEPPTLSNNFGTEDDTECEFVGFRSDFDPDASSTCTDYDAASCAIVAIPPTGPVTQSPVVATTLAPTPAPIENQNTPAPVEQQTTPAPTLMPTSSGETAAPVQGTPSPVQETSPPVQETSPPMQETFPPVQETSAPSAASRPWTKRVGLAVVAATALVAFM